MREHVMLPSDEADPLRCLSPYERTLCGWFVARAFAARTPRFLSTLQKYGPEGMAYYSCGRAFLLYGFVLLVGGVVLASFSLTLSYALLGLGGVCVILSVRRTFSMYRAGKEYRGE